jgi:FtsH-binding integral membrane protein
MEDVGDAIMMDAALGEMGN